MAFNSSNIYKIDEDNIYYNCLLVNDTPSSILATFDEVRTNYILNNCSNYYLSVVRVEIPVTNIPIFSFRNNNFYSITYENNNFFYQNFLQYIPGNINYKETDTLKPIYNYQIFVDMINNAFNNSPYQVEATSTANLNAVYNNILQTLTNNDAQTALILDGYSLNLNDLVLIQNQTDQTQNGVYIVSNVGSSSSNWILTRAYNTPLLLNSQALIKVLNGQTLGDNMYLMTSNNIVNIGVDNIVYTRFFPPFMTFDNINGIFNLLFARNGLWFLGYPSNNNSSTGVKLYFNSNLYKFFDSYDIFYNKINIQTQVSGQDLQIIVEDQGNNILYPPSLIGNDGSQYSTNILSYDGGYYIITQSYSTLFNWYDLKTIILASSIPTRNELYNNLLSSTNNQFKNMITDIIPLKNILTPYQQKLVIEYNDAQGRIIDLTSSEPLYRFDLQLYWTNYLNILIPLRIPQYNQISIKIKFQRKGAFYNFAEKIFKPLSGSGLSPENELELYKKLKNKYSKY